MLQLAVGLTRTCQVNIDIGNGNGNSNGKSNDITKGEDFPSIIDEFRVKGQRTIWEASKRGGGWNQMKQGAPTFGQLDKNSLELMTELKDSFDLIQGWYIKLNLVWLFFKQWIHLLT